MDKQAIAVLALGHFVIDFCQGVVPALVPFLVIERDFSYASAAALVFAISATSSVVQPLGRAVLRIGFTGAVGFLSVFLLITDRHWALAVLVPLAVFIFMPTSVLVVLGQEYLPQRVGMASGVTLGLAVSVGGMCAPLLGRLATARGLGFVLGVLLAMHVVATVQAFALPPVHGGERLVRQPATIPVAADLAE